MIFKRFSKRSRLIAMIRLREIYLEKRRKRCIQVPRQLHTNIRT